MKLRLAFTLILLFVSLTLSGCNSEPPTPGALTTFAAVCNKENEGKRLALEGYLRLPDSFTGDASVVTRLFETADFIGTPVASTIPIGEGPNTMDMVPKQYSDADLKFRASDGSALGYGDKIQLSGTMYFPSSLADVDFTCGLSNPLIEKAAG